MELIPERYCDKIVKDLIKYYITNHEHKEDQSCAEAYRGISVLKHVRGIEMKNDSSFIYKFANYITALLCSAGIAVCIGLFLYDSGIDLQGEAFYAQLYKLNVVADAMDKGMPFPLYVRHWYNGYEIFRYSPAGSYMLIVSLSRFFHADMHISICIFYGIMAFIAQMGFFLFGIRLKRMFPAFLTGLAFLLLPSTVFITILQENFDIVMGLAMMPLLLFLIHDFIKWRHRLALLPFSILFCIFILSHYVLSITFGIVLILYLFLHALSERSWQFESAAACSILLLYLVMGYFLYPAVSGGLLSKPYSLQGNWDISIGTAFFIIALLCLITSDRNRFAGFLMTIIGLVLSLPVMEPVRKLIPSVILQKAYWYLIPITVLFLITLLCWEKLRVIFFIIMLAVLVVESPLLIRSLPKGETVVSRMENMVSDYLLADAVSCAGNRIALIDQTTLGAYPHWYFVSHGAKTMYGWDFENSHTVRNQMNLNEAFADGFYDYMFDRLLLYGNDVAVILKELLPEAGSYDVLLSAAGRNGYVVEAENDKAVIFKAEDVTGSYGVITQYENLAIGDNAACIAYIYPSFEFGRSSCLEDYTIEELSKYEKLYLSGFTYRDKTKAENLLKELSRKGTEVYIDMQHIPVNALTGKNEFMGVYAQFVQFTEDFPILQNDNGNQFKLDFTAKGQGLWNTVYVSGCDEILKETTYDNKSHLTYLGKNYDPNITFMGFNLIYYYLTTHNQDLLRFLNEAMLLSPDDLPQPVIVPAKVEQNASQIKVQTFMDGVNCNIASVDTLIADRIISTQEDLFVVNQGETTFQIVYPGHRSGLLISILGLIATGVLWITVYVILDSSENAAS